MADAADAADAKVKPRLRGVSHQYGFFVSLAAGAFLVITAGRSHAAGAAVFALSLSALLGTSALYHRVDWTPARRALMRRMDHAMIYVLIAGTFTPICLLSLTAPRARLWLTIAWSFALAGALIRVVWLKAPKWISAVCAVGLGWLPAPIFSEVVAALGWPPVALIGLGGVSYTTGAVIYSLKRPDPLPEVFGYHEIFHALVLLGAALHYAAIYVSL